MTDSVGHAETIVAHVQQTITGSDTPLSSMSSEFCALWPQARPIIEVMSGVIMWVPGAGVMAGAVLQGLLKVGDQIAAEVCRASIASSA